MLENAIIDLIREGLKKPGKSQAGLANHLGVHPSAVSNMLKSDEDDGAKRRRIQLAEIEPILEYFGEDLPNEFNIYRNRNYVDLAPLRGVIQHGIWVSHDNLTARGGIKYVTLKMAIPYLPILGMETCEYYADQIADDHAADYAKRLAYVVSVCYAKVRDNPRSDDIAIIERHNSFSGGTSNISVVERTLRRISVERDQVILRPLSKEFGVEEFPYDPQNAALKISDLVVSSFTLSPGLSPELKIMPIAKIALFN